MDLVTLVSLLNAGTLSIALLGCLMFIPIPVYRGICVLLGMISFAALANVLEDLRVTHEFLLISPIFVLGYGPALYFAIKRLIVGAIGVLAAWHFLPMLLALPFASHSQSVIAVGTLLRIVYAILTLVLIVQFNRQLPMHRSDVSEVSLAWLGWLIGVVTLTGALDLWRLNFQLELGVYWNMMGYTASSLIYFIVLLLVILIMNNRRAGLEVLAGSTINESLIASDECKGNKESAADYEELYTILDKEIRTQKWYSLPRVTLNQLADLSGLSTRDISRCINLVAGMSFNDYINQHRIEQIKAALQREENGNLTNFALAAGFSSKATFNQSFKKVTGMTPSEFRTQQVQNHDSSCPVSGD